MAQDLDFFLQKIICYGSGLRFFSAKKLFAMAHHLDPATAKAGAAPLPNLGALEACCYIYDPQSAHFSHAFKVPFQSLQQTQIW